MIGPGYGYLVARPPADMTAAELKRILVRELAMIDADFAHLVGVSRAAVSMWVNDRRPIPGPVALLARLLVAAEQLEPAEGVAPIGWRQLVRTAWALEAAGPMGPFEPGY